MAVERQHAGVRARIVRPVDVTWREAKDQLFGVQRHIARAMNEAITDLCIEHRRGLLRQKGTKKGVPRQSRAYQLVCQYMRDVDANASSAILLGAAGVVHTRFGWWLGHQGEASLPTFSRKQPIVVASGQGRWSIRRVDGDVVVSTSLLAGRGQKIAFCVTGTGPGSWGHIRRMLECEDAKLSELKFQYDKDKHQWFANLGYSWPKPQPLEATGTLALHRGVARFLVSVSSSGQADVIDDGVALRRAKLSFSKRIGDVRRHLSRHAGSGARGRGRARRFKALERYRSAEADWSDTRCKQDAAKVVASAKRLGCGTVVIEGNTPNADTEASEAALGERVAWFVKRFPFEKLNACIETACMRAGIAVRTVPLRHISQRCPACGNIDAAQVDAARQRFECLACTYSDDVDVTAAFNMLAAAGEDDALRDVLTKRSTWREAAKKAKKTRLERAKSRRKTA